MYCKNCGNLIEEHVASCSVCKIPKGSGEIFCGSCGRIMTPGMPYCTTCGYKNSRVGIFSAIRQFVKQASNKDGCSKKTAMILAVVLGFTGLHNFYLGYNTKGLIQLILFILSFGFISYVWSVVETVMLITGNITKDANGTILAE